MNNIKKTVLGMLIGLLAFGISAYTAKKNVRIVRYYKTDITNYPNASDPNGYQYFSGERCEGGGSVCSAEWNIGTHSLPVEGEYLPLTGVSFQSGSAFSGHFE